MYVLFRWWIHSSAAVVTGWASTSAYVSSGVDYSIAALYLVGATISCGSGSKGGDPDDM